MQQNYEISVFQANLQAIICYFNAFNYSVILLDI